MRIVGRYGHEMRCVALIALVGYLMVGLESVDAQLSGMIEIDGSSTVFPISQAVAEEFIKVYPNVRMNVGFSGTGGGFGRFSRGETDISDASRPIKNLEAATAAKNGVRYVELAIAIDGLAIVVNPQNVWCDCITTAELARLWHPNATSGQPTEVTRWSQIRLGWPDRPVNLYGPGTDSGTFDYFTQVVVGEEGLSRPDYIASEDDNVLVQGIAGDENGLGYFGMAYYEENKDKVKVAGVDAGNGCVAPTRENILEGIYTPLARPLFIYANTARNNDTRAGSLQRAEVYAFVKFYTETARDTNIISDVGYVEYPDEKYDEDLQSIRQFEPSPSVPPFSPQHLVVLGILVAALHRRKRPRRPRR